MEARRRQEAALLYSSRRQPANLHGGDRQRAFERGDEAEGFLIVTAAADQGLVDIHDRRPLVMTPEAAREWMRQDIGERKPLISPPMAQCQQIILYGILFPVKWAM